VRRWDGDELSPREKLRYKLSALFTENSLLAARWSEILRQFNYDESTNLYAIHPADLSAMYDQLTAGFEHELSESPVLPFINCCKLMMIPFGC
jgi:hypothetical protein